MKVFLISVCLFIFSCLKAQNSSYHLSQLLQQVAERYPTIKARQAEINAATYYLKAARKDYLPDLTVADQYMYATDNGLEGSYYSNEGTAISTSSGIRDHNIYQGIFGSFTTLMVNWHAFDFGKVKENVRLAQERVQLAKASYANEVFQQQIRVADAYMLYVLSQKLVSVQQNNLQRSLAFQEYVLSHTRSGLMPGVDSSSANAEVAKAQLSLLQSQQYVQVQRNNLEQLSGIPADSILIDSTLFLHQVPSSFLSASSLNNHPVIQLAQEQMAAQYAQLNVLRKSVLPTINVLGIGWARGSGADRSTKALSASPADGIPYQTYNYMAGIALKWNITSLAKNKQQVSGGIQELEATRFRIEAEEAQLATETRNAELQYATALQQTQLAPVQYKAALDAYNLSNARYQAGLASLNEVIQAYYVLNRADVDEAVATNNVWRAILQHAAATGNLSEFTNQLSK
jgi:outer membrane protein TolC